MSPANKKPKKIAKKEVQPEDNLNSLRDEFMNEDTTPTLPENEEDISIPSEPDDLLDARLPQNNVQPIQDSSIGLGTKILGNEPEESGTSNIEISSKVEPEQQDDTQDNNFLQGLRSNLQENVDKDTDLTVEAMRAETLQPKYNEKPTIPRDAFQPDHEEETFLEELNKRNKTLPLVDSSTEDFINSVTNSLAEDPYLSLRDNAPADHAVTPEDSTPADSDYLAEIESEIENASQATNPFETSDSDPGENDFLTKLKEIFPENYTHDAITKPLDDFDEFGEGPASLSSESWQEVIKATEESATPLSSNFLLDQPQSNELEGELFGDNWQTLPIDKTPIYGVTEDDDPALLANEQTEESSLEADGENEPKESVDNLRRTFIEEFEQSPWPEEELIPEKEESWLSQKWGYFTHWIRSLNGAEKALLIMSSIITVAVFVAIGLVLIRWQGKATNNGNPPEPIASVDLNLIYPTGLQLPGGWFFFLQRGELKNDKWDPQTAEWLQTSTVRRVVAIPWSRQAEAVVQTLKEGDEVRVFMNNNDIMNYYVDKVGQVDREDVEILSSNEPSLAVILFKDDNSMRWVVFAAP